MELGHSGWRESVPDNADVAHGRGSEGISHAVMAESYALPGQIVVGTDSHTPHSGAVGCVAFGVGTTDMANSIVTGAVRLTVPQSLRTELNGSVPARPPGFSGSQPDGVIEFLNVRFSPGNWLYADEDGLVVLPRAFWRTD